MTIEAPIFIVVLIMLLLCRATFLAYRQGWRYSPTGEIALTLLMVVVAMVFIRIPK